MEIDNVILERTAHAVSIERKPAAGSQCPEAAGLLLFEASFPGGKPIGI
jgi:hypothetical protein